MLLKKILKSFFLLSLPFFFFSCKTLDIKNIESETNINKDDINQENISVPYEEKLEQTEDNEENENTKENKDNSTVITLSRKLTGKGILTATQLADFFISQRPDYDYISIIHFAQFYVVEASVEGINSDVAFAQMCLETGYLRFGGLVQPDFHNYCGLGAIDKDNPGCIFETEQMGVRAHIQHLQAYATTEEITLNNELIDPRYNWVHKTKYIESIDELTGNWATDPQYGEKIENILKKMEELVN